MSLFQDKYRQEIHGAMKESRGYSNPMIVPKIQKIVINTCVGTKHDRDALTEAADDLAAVTGQKAAITRARTSVSNFKLREGMNLGAKVTLRGERMYEFLQRLIQTSLPRIRDFRGVSSTAFDGRGNYSLGIHEHLIFPEINPDKSKTTHGMDVTIVTTAKTDDEALELLTHFGMPFATGQS